MKSQRKKDCWTDEQGERLANCGNIQVKGKGCLYHGGSSGTKRKRGRKGEYSDTLQRKKK